MSVTTNRKEITLSIFLLFLVLFSCKFAYSKESEAVNINPAVITVSSGPFKWGEDSGERFRVIVLLSEVYLSMYVQKIAYGPENCCAKIVNNYQLDLKKIIGDQQLYSVDDFVWLDFDKIQFKGNSRVYTVDSLSSKNSSLGVHE